jgi:hypothetical protein
MYSTTVRSLSLYIVFNGQVGVWEGINVTELQREGILKEALSGWQMTCVGYWQLHGPCWENQVSLVLIKYNCHLFGIDFCILQCY